MTAKHITASLCLALLIAPACADSAYDASNPRSGDKSDAISGNDNPDGLDATFTRSLSELVTSAEVGQSFGTDDDMIPYPDTYWPMVDNGIDAHWNRDANGEELPSPLEKFMSLSDPDKTEQAKAWETTNHGKEVPNVASWYGHCPGWSGAAVTHAPIEKAVFAKMEGGHALACEEGSDGCIKFEIGDINGLQAEVYNNARSRFIGGRCDTEPSKIERDEDGRIVRNGTHCQGLNAGSMVIVAGNMMKLRHKPFVIDAQNEFNTDQIWNQPAYRYTLNKFEALSEAEAAKLVSNGSKDSYEWNREAKGFARVDLTLHWVSETSGPNLSVVDGAGQTRMTSMATVVELDAPASDPNAQIIGGEFLDDASVGANRLKVAPFVWVPVAVGPDFGGGHNPFIKANTVLELIAMGERKAETPSEESCAHEVCAQGIALTDSCNSCASAVCAADGFCCQNEWDAMCVREAGSICGETCQ